MSRYIFALGVINQTYLLWSLTTLGRNDTVGRTDTSRHTQNALDRRGLEQPLQHTRRTTMLQTFMGRQRVFGPVSTMTELAHVQRVRLLVLVLEVSLQRVVTAERPSTVRTLLGLVDAPARWRRHPHRSYKRIVT